MPSIAAVATFKKKNVLCCGQAYHKSGYPGFVARLQERGPDYLKAVNWMSYQLAPRAQIFRRDSSNVTDFESLKSVMRYNSYKDDPVSFSASPALLFHGSALAELLLTVFTTMLQLKSSFTPPWWNLAPQETSGSPGVCVPADLVAPHSH